MKPNFLLGSDPEFFCKNIETNEYISLVPYLKGTKKNPAPIEVQGCSTLKDNVAIEINTPPVEDFWLLHSLIQECIDHTNNWLKDINPNFVLDIASSARFSKKELKTKESREFGCDPAFSIYSRDEMVPPPMNVVGNLRTAAYHIHYGWDEDVSPKDRDAFILLNDIFLGFPAIFKDPSDAERKEIYGKLGEYRVKYTDRVEYRTLGAGIHNEGLFIDRGIQLIKHYLPVRHELYNLYYELVKEIFLNPFNSDIKNTFKLLLIKNNHWNE